MSAINNKNKIPHTIAVLRRTSSYVEMFVVSVEFLNKIGVIKLSVRMIALERKIEDQPKLIEKETIRRKLI